MKTNKKLGLALFAAALLGAAATGQAAGPFNLNFDGTGSVASDFAPIFLTIGYGQFVPTLDGNGDSISGSEHWELDLNAAPVPVINPSTVGWGVAPSPSKALDVRDGAVLLVFDQPYAFESFSATLDNSTLGDLVNTAVKFYGASNNELFSADVNQSTPGATVNVGYIGEVKTIMLPSTAFYDNVQVVPEPATFVSLMAGAGLLAMRRRRCIS